MKKNTCKGCEHLVGNRFFDSGLLFFIYTCSLEESGKFIDVSLKQKTPKIPAWCPILQKPNKDLKELMKDGGNKYDKKKLRMDLLPLDALMGAATTFTYGAIKYDDWNWAKGLSWSRCYGALKRHLSAFWNGEDIDEESGLFHIDQVSFYTMILSHFAKNPEKYKKFDDRPKDMKQIHKNVLKIIDDNSDKWLDEFGNK